MQMKKTIVVLLCLINLCVYSQDTISRKRLNESQIRDNILNTKDLLKVNRGILFDNTNGLSYTPATSGHAEFYHLGNIILGTLQSPLCPNPNNNTLPQFINNGSFISRTPPAAPGSSNLTNSSLSFYSAPWNGSGHVEVEGVDNNGEDKNALFINYFCHRNTAINVGWDLSNGTDGGTVFMGAKVDMQKSLKIGWSQSGTIDLNTSIDINQNANNANGVKVNTWNNSIKAFSVERPDGKNSFIVYGNGNAYFGLNRIKANHPHANCQYQFDGKIGCKELVVVDPAKWADFVFDKNYNLLPLVEVEAFYKKNRHLPSVPSEREVKENGINTAEMDAILLQKIEELTLYVVQQQKEIVELKKRIKK